MLFFFSKHNPRPCTAIGEYVLDLTKIVHLFNNDALVDERKARELFEQPTLNAFIDQTPEIWHDVRVQLQRLLSKTNSVLRDDEALRKDCLHLQADVRMHLPVKIGDYTDFYSSKEHARNIGEMFRGKDNALLPNWLHLPGR